MEATNDFISVNTIICPYCKIKQTAIVKLQGKLPYIKCCNKKCDSEFTGEFVTDLTGTS